VVGFREQSRWIEALCIERYLSTFVRGVNTTELQLRYRIHQPFIAGSGTTRDLGARLKRAARRSVVSALKGYRIHSSIFSMNPIHGCGLLNFPVGRSGKV